MKPLFRKRRAVAEGQTETRPVEPAVAAAYQRGRKDERASRRRSPLLAMTLVAVALVGGASLVLAAREGSFRDGGAVMDAGVGVAAREAGPALKEGARQAGAGLRKVQDNFSSEQPG